MSSAYSASIARIRHHLPSKRKLDDYASVAADADPLSMHSPNKMSSFSPPSSLNEVSGESPADDPSSSSRAHTSPTLSPSLASFSCDSIHFFVRTDSGTLVLHSCPSATIKSVIDQIRHLTGVPTSTTDHRLIYRGRQLDPDSTLSTSGVDTDASLHLTGRLRSTRFPRAWRLVHDLDKSARCLLSGAPVPREISDVDSLLTDFLSSAPTGIHGEIEDSTLDYLQVFILGAAPASLIRLYISNSLNCRHIAEQAVRLFLNPVAEFLPKSIQIQCWTIVLQFCKLIAGTKGKNDALYVSCRSTLGSLLEAQGGFGSLGFTKGWNLVVELFPFVKELVEIVVKGLSSDAMFVSSSELSEFSSFLIAMRRAVKDWMGWGGQIPKSLLDNNTHPRFEGWIYSLHAIFLELLEKVDECLKKVEAFLAEKGMVQSDAPWAMWSHILTVLTNVHSFSKIYEGAPELLHAVLLNRRVSVNALIRRAKKNENLRWLLKQRDVIDFESRRSLVMMLFPEGKDDYEHLHEMLIDRSQLLAESFEYIGRADAHALHGGLFMEFKNEEATGPGVLREWFCLVCRAIFNPQNVLFLPCPNDRRRFFPNPGEFLDSVDIYFLRPL